MTDRAFAVATRRVVLANAVGVVVLFVYLALTDPPATRRTDSPGVVVWTLVVAYVLVAGITAYRTFRRRSAPIRAWRAEDRAPTTAERMLVATIVDRTSWSIFGRWMLGAALSSADIVVDPGSGDILRRGLAIVLGGLTTTLLAHLTMEHTFRPLYADAFTGGEPMQRSQLGIRQRLLLAWALGSGAPIAALLLATVNPPSDRPVDLQDLVFFLGPLSLIAGGFFVALAAHTVAEPLETLRRRFDDIRGGDLDVRVAVDDRGEVGQLQAGLNEMAEGLAERRRIEDLFGRHVGTRVAERALTEAFHLRGEQCHTTCLFVDLINSTGFTHRHPPQEVLSLLNAFFGAVVDAVTNEDGWVNKFEGDAALCVFGAPVHQADHAARALRAGRAIRASLDELARHAPDIDAGIGIASGTVVAGNVGSETRYEYTVIGDPVNQAARLTELAKARPERVLATASVIEEAGQEANCWVECGPQHLRGHRTPVVVFTPARA